MKNYANIIKKYRFEKNLSMEDFSKVIGVSLMTVHRWEQDKNKPSEELRIKIDQLIESAREEKHGDITLLLQSVEKNMLKVVNEINILKEWLTT